jgi:threonine dehydratase
MAPANAPLGLNIQDAMNLPVSYADVVAAAARIAGAAHRTPVLTSSTADARTGAKMFFKPENLQRMGAFKFRGAYNAIARLEGDARKRGVLAFSSGNHAQAIALAGRLQGVAATIVMPSDAPAIKLAATRGYGAEVITYDRMTEDREALARRIAAERGLSLIPPYDHREVIAGHGTAARELIDEVGELDVLLPGEPLFSTRFVSATGAALRVWRDAGAYERAGCACRGWITAGGGTSASVESPSSARRPCQRRPADGRTPRWVAGQGGSSLVGGRWGGGGRGVSAAVGSGLPQESPRPARQGDAEGGRPAAAPGAPR